MPKDDEESIFIFAAGALHHGAVASLLHLCLCYFSLHLAAAAAAAEQLSLHCLALIIVSWDDLEKKGTVLEQESLPFLDMLLPVTAGHRLPAGRPGSVLQLHLEACWCAVMWCAFSLRAGALGAEERRALIKTHRICPFKIFTVASHIRMLEKSV